MCSLDIFALLSFWVVSEGWECQAFLMLQPQGQGLKKMHITIPFLFPCQHNHTWGKPTHFTGNGDMAKGTITSMTEMLKNCVRKYSMRRAE